MNRPSPRNRPVKPGNGPPSKNKWPPVRRKLPRLPDGSHIELDYNGATEEWIGVLVVKHNGQLERFQLNSKKVFTLMSRLDACWRKFLAAHPAKA